MNKYAKIVLWLGLFMIVAGLVKQWPEVSAVLFKHSSLVPHHGDVFGNPPTNTPPVNGKCPAGYVRTGPNQCTLHSRLPL